MSFPVIHLMWTGCRTDTVNCLCLDVKNDRKSIQKSGYLSREKSGISKPGPRVRTAQWATSLSSNLSWCLRLRFPALLGSRGRLSFSGNTLWTVTEWSRLFSTSCVKSKKKQVGPLFFFLHVSCSLCLRSLLPAWFFNVSQSQLPTTPHGFLSQHPWSLFSLNYRRKIVTNPV